MPVGADCGKIVNPVLPVQTAVAQWCAALAQNMVNPKLEVPGLPRQGRQFRLSLQMRTIEFDDVRMLGQAPKQPGRVAGQFCSKVRIKHSPHLRVSLLNRFDCCQSQVHGTLWVVGFAL